MAVTIDRVEAIFADARFMHSEALARLEAGDIRDAAEKAWCATKRATDGMVLKITGSEPQSAGQARKALLSLRDGDGDGDGPFSTMLDRYAARSSVLHADCFYDGICDPLEPLARMIRGTFVYIGNAERLANEPGATIRCTSQGVIYD